MHIAKELLYNVSSSNLNRFLSEHNIKNEQKMRYADHRVMLEQFIKDGLITIGVLNDFFLQRVVVWASSADASVFYECKILPETETQRRLG